MKYFAAVVVLAAAASAATVGPTSYIFPGQPEAVYPGVQVKAVNAVPAPVSSSYISRQYVQPQPYAQVFPGQVTYTQPAAALPYAAQPAAYAPYVQPQYAYPHQYAQPAYVNAA